MNLGELRGWVEENRIVLREEGLERNADFLVKMMVKDRMQGREYTAEMVMAKVLEFAARKGIKEREEGTQAEQDMAVKQLAAFMKLAKKLGLSSTEMTKALLRSVKPLRE